MISTQSNWTEMYLNDLHGHFIDKRFEANAPDRYKLINNQ
jgi:hypothetical protein